MYLKGWLKRMDEGIYLIIMILSLGFSAGIGMYIADSGQPLGVSVAVISLIGVCSSLKVKGALFDVS